jgi:hypothetical protein
MKSKIWKYEKRTIFTLQKRLTEFRLKEISSFIDHSRDGMKATWKEFSKEFDETTKGLTGEQIAEYVDHIYDDMAMLRDESPQLLRHAQCMIVYGTFESSIVNLCWAAHKYGKINDAPTKKNMYMDDVKGYLRPHIRTHPAPFAKEWQWLHEFRIIRNWMAHNGGKTQEDTQPSDNWANAQTFVRRNRDLIKFAKSGEIIVEDGLIDRAIEKTTRAITRIEKAVQALYPR